MCIYPQHWGFPALTEPSASPAGSLGIFEVRRGENLFHGQVWLDFFLMSIYLGLKGEGMVVGVDCIFLWLFLIRHHELKDY